MPVEASDVSRGAFVEGRGAIAPRHFLGSGDGAASVGCGGTWRLERWAGPSVVAGVTTRHAGVAELLQALPAGVRTACGTTQWFSLRREGPATGRMVSFILIRP